MRIEARKPRRDSCQPATPLWNAIYPQLDAGELLGGTPIEATMPDSEVQDALEAGQNAQDDPMFLGQYLHRLHSEVLSLVQTIEAKYSRMFL